jgi:hypothetical protein
MYRVIQQFSGFEVGTVLTDAQLKDIEADVKDLIEVGCLERGTVLTKDEARAKKLDLALLPKAYADGEWKVWMAADKPLVPGTPLNDPKLPNVPALKGNEKAVVGVSDIHNDGA